MRCMWRLQRGHEWCQKHSSAQEEKETKRFAQILKAQDWQSQRAQEFIAKFKAIDDKRLSQFATEWKDLIKMEKEHEGSCTNKSVKCNGCSKVVCKHLGNYICSSRPVCAWCDSFGQPNPFNPKNRMAYLPKTKIADDLCKDIDHVEQNKRKSWSLSWQRSQDDWPFYTRFFTISWLWSKALWKSW